MPTRKRKIIPSEELSLLENQSVAFLPPKEWSEVFVEAIRYKSKIIVKADGDDVITTRLSNYSINAEKDLFRCESVQFAVHADRLVPAHMEFLKTIATEHCEHFEVQIHLPDDLIRCRVTSPLIERSKIHFALEYPPFRQFGRKFTRVSVRIPVICNVFFSTESDRRLWIKGEGTDISEGGLGFILRQQAMNHLPPVGSVVDGIFFRVNGHLCKIKAVIRHVSLVKQNQFPQQRFRVGIEFVETDDLVGSQIRAFVFSEIKKLVR